MTLPSIGPVPDTSAAQFTLASAGRQTAVEPGAAPGLIETMRVEAGGDMPLLEGHLQRLHRSCTALGHTWPGEAAIRQRVSRILPELDSTKAWRLRLLLSPDGVFEIERAPLAPTAQPVAVIVTGPRQSGAGNWLGYKTTHRPWYQGAAQWLAEHPAVFDVLYWNEEGNMCEGSRSNIYMLAPDGRWLTPPLAAGVLPGVQREALLRAGLVYEAAISRDEFLNAPAWRISNALRGWLDARPLTAS